MKVPEIAQAGQVGKVATTRSVVVYNRKDGRIVHIHHVIALEGTEPSTVSENEKAALFHAGRRGHEESKIAALHVDSASLKEGGHYKVDVKVSQLVEAATAKRPTTKAPAKRKATKRSKK